MSTTAEAAPEVINPGQHLMGLYQDVWSAEARMKRLVRLSPDFGLERAVDELDLTRYSLAELSSEELAKIGKDSLWAYFNAETREEDRKQALINKAEAELVLMGSIRLLAGRSVTVEALKADDKPISIRPNDEFSKLRTRSPVAAVTGFLTPHSADNYWGRFTPYNLRLARSQRRGLLSPLSHYRVSMCDPLTDEPRVALTID